LRPQHAPEPGELSLTDSHHVPQPLAVEADLHRLVRALLHGLKRQVIDNVVLTVHTDFDADVVARNRRVSDGE
jgi:hypothetical protein